jgi:hypothetical protein
MGDNTDDNIDLYPAIVLYLRPFSNKSVKKLAQFSKEAA